MSGSLVFLFVTLLPLVSLWSFGGSTISNQLVAGSTIVRHIKSILEPSLPLRVYRPMRSTHNTSQGVVMTSFCGTCLHFCCVSYWPGKICKIWHMIGWYVTYLSNTSWNLLVSSRRECPGCWMRWWYQLIARCCRDAGMTILSSLQSTLVFSISWKLIHFSGVLAFHL